MDKCQICNNGTQEYKCIKCGKVVCDECICVDGVCIKCHEAEENEDTYRDDDWWRL